jgi:large subunit ribosomal protein L46
VTANASTAEYITHSGILLSRPPLLTNPPTAFEKAFYFYQKRLNERLVMPFTRYFYFKKDTPALADWKIKAAERDWQPARELGGYNAHREDAWNDELLVGDKLSETSSLVDALVNEATPRAIVGKDGKPIEATEEEMVRVQKPLGRITEADRTNDQKRLDRKLNRTLYLCVKREKGGWGFPAGALEGRENLDQVCACFTCFSHFSSCSESVCCANMEIPGCGTCPRPDGWHEHEYLDHRARSCRTPHPSTLLPRQ